MDREKIKSLLGQAILRVNEVVPDFEDLDKVLPLLRQAIDELDKSDSGSVKKGWKMANKQTIKPKVVPFEIAKLLKEVGYDEKIAEFWAYASPWTAKGGIRKGGKYNEHYGSYIAYSNSEWEKSNIEFSAALKLNSKHPAISAPSYDMVEYGHVTLDELQVVKKQYPWFAPVVDNWKELSLLFEEELDKRLYIRIRQLCKESYAIRYEVKGGLYYERGFWYNV